MLRPRWSSELQGQPTMARSHAGGPWAGLHRLRRAAGELPERRLLSSSLIA
jgi:hypothetical protein